MKEQTNREEMIKAIENLEGDIVKERVPRRDEGRSGFSYWMYEVSMIPKWLEENPTTAQLESRLQEVIKQSYIDIEDNPLDEEICAHAKERIKEAKKLLDSLTA